MKDYIITLDPLHLEADDNWEDDDKSLLPDLVLLAELAAEVRYKK